MFRPLVWLFIVGGVYPNNTVRDTHITAALLLAESYCFFANVYQTLKSGLISFDVSFNLLNDAFDCIFGLLFILKVYLQRHTFIYLFERLAIFDFPSENKRISTGRTEISALLMFLVMIGGRAPLHSGDLISIAVKLGYDLIMGLLYAPTILYVVLVRHLSARFSALNTQLREVAQVSSPTDLRADLASVFQAHLYLRNLQTQLDSFFGLFNAASVINHTTFIVVALYYIICVMNDSKADVKLLDVVIIVTVCTTVFHLSDTPHRCSEKVDYI